MEEPLTLQILRLVEQFSPKSLPVSFLQQKLPASSKDIAERLHALAEQGAVKLEGDQVSTSKP